MSTTTERLAALLLAAMTASAAGAQTILRVRAGAPAGGDGSSWAAARNNLSTALSAAPTGSEIWVAAGTYVPVAGPAGTTFALRSGVAVYGGFAGTEATRDQRDPLANRTVLFGGSNVRHVVFASYADASAVLDGFAVQGGEASSAAPDNRGGGILISGGAPVVRGCVISGNTAGSLTYSDPGGGGGIAILGGAAPLIDGCTIESNSGRAGLGNGCGAPATPGASGGGVLVESSQPVFMNCRFLANHAGAGGDGFSCGGIGSPGTEAGKGGAIYAQFSTMTVRGCTFNGNSGGRGGAPDLPGGDGGAIYLDSSSADLRESRFTDNTAGNGSGGRSGTTWQPDGTSGGHGGSGGGVFALNGSPVTASACSFVGNRAGNGGGGGYGNRSGNGADGGSGGAVTAETCGLTGCTFVANQAGSGGPGGGGSGTLQGGAGGNGGRSGGLECQGQATLLNCLVAGNTAGALGRGGIDSMGRYAADGSAGNGGGLSAPGGGTLTNCTVYTNSAPGLAGGVAGSAAIFNSVVWGNSDSTGTGLPAQIGGQTTVAFSCVQSLSPGVPGMGNTAADPRFFDPLGPDGLPGTPDDDLRLRPNSPCIDAADNTALPLGTLTDLAGLPRIHDDPGVPDRGLPGGDGGPAIADMGAYEFQGISCRVDLNGDGRATVADALTFFQLFAAADPRADFNADGQSNLPDFLAFLSTFAAGCP